MALRIRHYFRRFLAGTATAMDFTTRLAPTVTGGVLRRMMQTMLGPESFTTSMAVRIVTKEVRGLGCLLGASRIKQYDDDYLTI